MSQDLLEKVLNNQFELDFSKKIVCFLKNYKKGDLIYPSLLKRKLNVNDDLVYKILSVLEKNNLLKINYEYFCYKCNSGSRLYQYYSEIPETYLCDNCEDNLTMNNVKVVYKVN